MTGRAKGLSNELAKHNSSLCSASAMVWLANALFDKVKRPIDWVHMPVPVERDDDAYYAPLAQLRLPATTRLYLGLIHQQARSNIL